jgi:hypothetical protein
LCSIRRYGKNGKVYYGGQPDYGHTQVLGSPITPFSGQWQPILGHGGGYQGSIVGGNGGIGYQQQGPLGGGFGGHQQQGYGGYNPRENTGYQYSVDHAVHNHYLPVKRVIC